MVFNFLQKYHTLTNLPVSDRWNKLTIAFQVEFDIGNKWFEKAHITIYINSQVEFDIGYKWFEKAHITIYINSHGLIQM